MKSMMKLKKEYQKYLEVNALGITTEEDVATEEELQELMSYQQYLMKGLQPPSANKIHLNTHLEHLAGHGERLINQSGDRLVTPYYFGEFPTGEINACTVKIDEGHLYLVNTGSMLFLSVLTKILSHSMCHLTWDEFDYEIIVEENHSPTPYSLELLLLRLRALLFRYMLGESFTGHGLLVSPTGVAYQASKFLLSHMEMFIVLHEFAHSICGHLEGQSTVQKSLRQGGHVEVASKDIQQEYEADAKAIGWLVSSIKDLEGKNESLKKIWVQTIGTGIFVLFMTMEFLEDNIRHKNFMEGKKTMASHPPAQKRLMKIDEKANDYLGQTGMKKLQISYQEGVSQAINLMQFMIENAMKNK